MKINLTIDCTPEEARALMGLPDVSAINDTITEAMLARTKENIDSLSDPQIFWEKMMAASGSSMELMQRLFSQGAGSSSKG